MTSTLEHVFSWTHTLSGVISLSAFGYKWRDLRRDPGNLALRALCGTRLFNGIAYLFLAPVSYRMLGRLTGVPNLGTLLGHSSIVLAALSAHVMVTGWFHSPEEARRRLPRVAALYLSAIAAMTALFLAAPLPGAHPVDFEVHFATRPAAGAYVLLFLLTYGLNLANTARHVWPSSRAVARPRIAQSLRLSAVGAFFVLGFILGKLVGLVGRWCGQTAWDQAAVLWSPVMASTGSLVIVLGYTLPGWGTGLATRLEHHRSYRTLHPLWSALCEAAPGIALLEPRSPRFALCAKDLHTRLYRMVIEIRDGQRMLRPYVCDVCEDRLRAGLRAWRPGQGDDTDVLLEAAVLALTVRRKRTGHQPSGTWSGPGSRQSGSEFADELAWLRQVAEAYARVSADRGPLSALPPCDCTVAPGPDGTDGPPAEERPDPRTTDPSRKA
ncbi:MAB_1171c family putative transporter [Streptomyces sp. NPDC127190]|uniref:MAB_1171c family putative transporter n=1 Tax=unclassified Streptomyces TaxID=2593676 RepID=UPI0036321785